MGTRDETAEAAAATGWAAVCALFAACRLTDSESPVIPVAQLAALVIVPDSALCSRLLHLQDSVMPQPRLLPALLMLSLHLNSRPALAGLNRLCGWDIKGVGLPAKTRAEYCGRARRFGQRSMCSKAERLALVVRPHDSFSVAVVKWAEPELTEAVRRCRM